MAVILPQPSACWNDGGAPPLLACTGIFKASDICFIYLFLFPSEILTFLFSVPVRKGCTVGNVSLLRETLLSMPRMPAELKFNMNFKTVYLPAGTQSSWKEASACPAQLALLFCWPSRGSAHPLGWGLLGWAGGMEEPRGGIQTGPCLLSAHFGQQNKLSGGGEAEGEEEDWPLFVPMKSVLRLRLLWPRPPH